jgi:hypothetical protein
LAHDDIAVTTAAIAKNLQKLLIFNDHAPYKRIKPFALKCFQAQMKERTPAVQGLVYLG